jgi:tetratricopeptide (TPR) repeat protein
MRAKLGLSGLLLASALLLSARARAEDSRDPAAAEELFRQGRAASQKQDFTTACAKFRESNRLDPAIGTVFNIADCEEKLGRLATSWTLFQEVVQRLPNDDERRTIASERARALEGRVPTLTIHLGHSDRNDVIVRRDGVVLGAASLETALPVDPGEHTVMVEAPGTQSALFSSRVGVGEHASLQVQVGTISTTTQQGLGPSSNPSPTAAHPSHTAAYLAGGVGVAGLVTGVVAGLIVLNEKSTVDSECVGKVCSQAGVNAASSGKTFGVVTTVGLLTGALGLGTATYLFLSAPATENPRSSAYLLGIRAKW